MLKDDRTIKRYSESFKLQVLSELEAGKFTKCEIIRNYSIGAGTLNGWIKKYGKFALFNKRIKIETMEDVDKIKKLESEIKQLKELLINKDIKSLLDDSYLDFASKKLGYKSVEELKKKLNIK
ncbi:transposase [Bacteroidota bacterium]